MRINVKTPLNPITKIEVRHVCVKFDAHNNDHDYARCAKCGKWSAYDDIREDLT